MSDIIEIRHAIGTDATGPSSSSSASGSKKMVAPPPPQVVRVKSIPVLSSSSGKKGKEPEGEPSSAETKKADRSSLFVKVHGYLTSKPLQPYIPPGIKMPTEGASIEVLEATYKQIQDGLKAAYKRKMVDSMFGRVAEAGEAAMIHLFHLDYAYGLADALKDSKEDFQPELEELALEMDESMVPGPKIRLGLKLLEFVDGFLRRGYHPDISNQPASNDDTPKL